MWKKKRKEIGSSLFLRPLWIFIKKTRMRRRRIIYGDCAQFPNSRPEANLESSSSSSSSNVTTRRADVSKLDGFNRRLIIVWIFHRAIFLLNNVQREIQRSLLSSIRAYPRIPSTIYSFFKFFDRNCGDRRLGWNATKQTRERNCSRSTISILPVAIKIEIFDLSSMKI